MQLCRKDSLKDWLEENLVRQSDIIVRMFTQIVSAVEYVHKNNLIHRDLKPSNIFFSINGEIKVGDFGLVTECEECCDVELEEEFEEVSNDDAFKPKKLKKHTKAVGTQLYMSPEQLNGSSYNYKVDIYSLGVILFELLVPFQTTMERIKTLSDLRRNSFPVKFRQDFCKEVSLNYEFSNIPASCLFLHISG